MIVCDGCRQTFAEHPEKSRTQLNLLKKSANSERVFYSCACVISFIAKNGDVL